MKTDFNVKERGAAAKKIYDTILKKEKSLTAVYDMVPKDGVIPDVSNAEKCLKCGKGRVLIDLSKEPDWTYILDRSVCMNVGGHSLLFVCSECGGHITKRGVDTCKSNHPKYQP
jgi:hypothetical protein